MTFSEILSLAPAFSAYTTPIPAELDKGYYIKMIYDRLADFGVTFDTLGGGL